MNLLGVEVGRAGRRWRPLNAAQRQKVQAALDQMRA